ncbi:MAG TPA: hypothetical protein VF221_22530 [Chloroflexota bacterium]
MSTTRIGITHEPMHVSDFFFIVRQQPSSVTTDSGISRVRVAAAISAECI